MLFHTATFAIFFCVVASAVALVRGAAAKKIVLLVASYVFYGWVEPLFLAPLVATTLIDYLVGRSLGRTPRRGLLIVSIVANLTLLAVFKYFAFALTNVAALVHAIGFDFSPPLVKLILPVGISFYTFHSLSYVIDVYRRETPACRSLLDYALFIAFFPVLVAGPILRAKHFLPQLEVEARVAVTPGTLLLFARGLAKKVLVADNLSPFVDAIFVNPRPWPSIVIWTATIAFAVQIYCDFSGYSDMARALAAAFGFEVPRNFERPYFAASPREFWRRWHISLSTWLRDYLYVPLGGNRRRLVFNLMITMLLGGLWHGAKWTFVVWGAMHGLLLVVQHLASRRTTTATAAVQTAGASAPSILSCLATQFAVLTAWIVFRSADLPTAAVALRKFILFDFDLHLRHQGLGGLLFATTLVILVAFAAVHTWSWRRGDLDVRLANAPAPLLAAACILLGVLFVAFWPSEGQPFIYFQF